MRLSLHILYALAALATVTAAASLGAQQGLTMGRPGGDVSCHGCAVNRIPGESPAN